MNRTKWILLGSLYEDEGAKNHLRECIDTYMVVLSRFNEAIFQTHPNKKFVANRFFEMSSSLLNEQEVDYAVKYEMFPQYLIVN